MPVSSLESLNVSWREYVRLILHQEGKLSTNGGGIAVQGYNSYLEEVHNCRNALRTVTSYMDLLPDKRKLIAGFGPCTTGFFGHMRASPSFTGTVQREPEQIARHLDQLPIKGPITVAVARMVLEGLLSVHGVALATATRLLTAYRPDRFFPVNGANRVRARRIFGTIRDQSIAHRSDDYLRALQQVWQLPWARAPKPDRGLQRQLWGARVGLLDALLYEA